jgi:hypothetical protein
MCVQRFDDSRNSAIRITYRISLRSSSMPEPRDPLLKVLKYLFFGTKTDTLIRVLMGHWRASTGGLATGGSVKNARQSNKDVEDKNGGTPTGHYVKRSQAEILRRRQGGTPISID